jgi:hypothetical protein
MTSTIKVDNIQNQCGANIINESSNTITLGASGDTIALASGASQTGFGRTGTVDWVTTVQTSGFTAENGKGYFVNTTSGAISVNLPAGSAGDIVAFKDYANTWDTNAVTLVQNGSDKIGGSTINGQLETEGIAVTLVFIDSTQGWLVTNSGLQSEAPTAQYIVATGGTITTDGNFKVHTFTSPGTFTVSSAGNAGGSNEISYMVVAGGGGSGGDSGGGGGAGGFREGKTPQCTYTSSPLACTSGSNNGLPVTATGYPVTVGAGGTAGTGAPPTGTPAPGGNGSPSTFAGTTTITSTGGGGGGDRVQSSNGSPGGSGGGARTISSSGGTGNTPPVSPPQGNDGGGASPTPGGNTAGGGGATAVGVYAPSCSAGGPGGNGATTSINGTPTAFAGGGGGGGSSGPANVGGNGGTGGGGDGVQGTAPNVGNPGTVNTGGGGGGGGDDATGGAGGSGIVIIRYKFQ